MSHYGALIVTLRRMLASAYHNPTRKRGNGVKAEAVLAYASGYDGNVTIKAHSGGGVVGGTPNRDSQFSAAP